MFCASKVARYQSHTTVAQTTLALSIQEDGGTIIPIRTQKVLATTTATLLVGFK